jgi:azurin
MGVCRSMKVGMMAAVLTLGIAAGAQAQAPRVITLTVSPAMKYSLSNIEAKPGEALTVKLVVEGTASKLIMGHNFVLLTAKSDPAAFANAALTAKATDYIPPALKGQVLATTTIIGGGETTQVTFNAPKEPGVYPFLCSFTGHFLVGMKGTLTVK